MLVFSTFRILPTCACTESWCRHSRVSYNAQLCWIDATNIKSGFLDVKSLKKCYIPGKRRLLDACISGTGDRRIWAEWGHLWRPRRCWSVRRPRAWSCWRKCSGCRLLVCNRSSGRRRVRFCSLCLLLGTTCCCIPEGNREQRVGFKGSQPSTHSAGRLLANVAQLVFKMRASHWEEHKNLLGKTGCPRNQGHRSAFGSDSQWMCPSRRIQPSFLLFVIKGSECQIFPNFFQTFQFCFWQRFKTFEWFTQRARVMVQVLEINHGHLCGNRHTNQSKNVIIFSECEHYLAYGGLTVFLNELQLPAWPTIITWSSAFAQKFYFAWVEMASIFLYTYLNIVVWDNFGHLLNVSTSWLFIWHLADISSNSL